jgi:hypothetical protein
MSYKVSDTVAWTAYPSGIARRIEGQVVEVLSAGSRPDKSRYPSLYARGDLGQARGHISYIVKANGKIYWPVVSRLTLVAAAPVVAQAGKPKKKQSLIEQIVPTAVPKASRIVNYVGFVADHSGSMSNVRSQAMNDFNENIDIIQQKNEELDQETFVSVNRCGIKSSGNDFLYRTVDVSEIKTLNRYDCVGNTPLWDSIGDLIDDLKFATRHNINDDVSYLIMVLTDGDENASRKWSAFSLKKEIRDLTNTGRWTFVFRVPYGRAGYIVSALDIPRENVIEWDGRTVESYAKTTLLQNQGLERHFLGRASGQTASASFYANLQADDKTIQRTLTDLTDEVWLWPVTREMQIRDFVEQHVSNYTKGKAFYQLTKSEEVQGYKDLIIQSKVDGKIYGGEDARKLLNIPDTVGTIRVRPGQTGNYDVFIKSTSVNRKLQPNTRLLYLK